ncbi:MAG: 5'-nucleotidase C-terminal domain-containing protein, partial [Deltaproteobacteria bacterium]|nr:5'-nucleotidase C-terminal domain-containing protein [Deltaproteobacteria bacterium]
FGLTRKLAAKLKQEADLVVVISHNGMSTNKLIAGLPNVDIVIHAHDHEKLQNPVVVEHNGKTAIMVEAQHWGFYLGRLDLMIDTVTKKYQVKNYKLIQMDDTIPEDPGMMSLVANYDRQLEQKYGDIFHDHLADTEIDIRRDGTENLYGNLLTDAYREFAGADVAFEQASLTSNALYKGQLSTVDFYNALTAIWSPYSEKAWTLKTVRMTGETLNWVLNFVLSASAYIPGGLLSVSGMHAVYDPMVLKDTKIKDDEKRPLKSLEIGGKPLDLKKSYLVAIPEGINEAIDFLEKFWGNKVDRTDFRDTGVEDWRVAANYVAKHSPITAASISRGGRLTVLQSDLALYHDDVVTTRSGTQVHASVTVRNLGSTTSVARQLQLTYDKTPTDFTDDPNPMPTDTIYTVPPIAAGASVVIDMKTTLPSEMASVRVPLYFTLNTDPSDPNKSNDGTWLLMERDGTSRALPPNSSPAAAQLVHHDD